MIGIVFFHRKNEMAPKFEYKYLFVYYFQEIRMEKKQTK